MALLVQRAPQVLVPLAQLVLLVPLAQLVLAQLAQLV
jgi:hypothetical protein